MGDPRLPKRVLSGELENAGKRGPRGKEKEWADCVAENRQLFGMTGDWTPPHLAPGFGKEQYAKGAVSLCPHG